MAFDPNQHKLDDQGFIVDKETGHRVGMENPAHVSPQDVQYPKWVKVHDDHVMRQNAQGEPHISVAKWPFEVDRTNNQVRVLVKDAADEADATSGVHHEDKPQDEKPHEDAEKNA